MLYLAQRGIWVPRYQSPERPNPSLLIPPSPPAQQREKRRARLLRDLREVASYTGRLILPGYVGYYDELKMMSRIGTPGAMTGGLGVLGGIETHLYGSNVNADWTNIVAYWNMDQATGATRTDITLRGNDLSDNGNATQETGKINNAAGFDGTTSMFLSKTSSTDVQMGNSTAFTIGGWIYRVGIVASDNDTFLCKGAAYASSSGTREYGASLQKNAGSWFIHCFWSTNGSNEPVDFHSTTAISLTTWYFWCIGYDGSSVAFVNTNAGSRTTATGQTGPNAGSGDFLLGKTGANPPSYVKSLNGRLDGVFVFKGAMISTTVESNIYNSGNGKDYPN